MGRHYWVFGGTSGIGRAVVETLASAGHSVLAAGRDRARGQALVEAHGPRVRFIPCDVSREAELEAFRQQALEGAPPLDGAVNAAGLSPRRAAFDQLSPAEWDEVFEVNVRGLWLCLRAEREAFAGRPGSIVNVASILGLKAQPILHAAYTASKHAVVGLTRAAALETAAQGLRINAVCPGGVDTPIHQRNSASPTARQALEAAHPLGRMASPEEVASIILTLLDPSSSFVTGAVWAVDGGLSAL